MATRQLTPAAQTAKTIRHELREHFPNIKFSVRSSNFANGDSVDIAWIDGPTRDEVETITGKYQDGHFDGMTDMYEYDDHKLGGAKFISPQRRLSDEFKAELQGEIEASLGEPIDGAKNYGSVAIKGMDHCLHGPWGSNLVYQLSVHRSRP